MSKPTILCATLRIDSFWCQMTVQYRSGAVRIYRHRNNSAATFDAWLPVTVRDFMSSPFTNITYREGKVSDHVVLCRRWIFRALQLDADCQAFCPD